MEVLFNNNWEVIGNIPPDLCCFVKEAVEEGKIKSVELKHARLQFQPAPGYYAMVFITKLGWWDKYVQKKTFRNYWIDWTLYTAIAITYR